jgi:hypothetical protein
MRQLKISKIARPLRLDGGRVFEPSGAVRTQKQLFSIHKYLCKYHNRHNKLFPVRGFRKKKILL